jgi:hypothetical protein
MDRGVRASKFSMAHGMWWRRGLLRLTKIHSYLRYGSVFQEAFTPQKKGCMIQHMLDSKTIHIRPMRLCTILFAQAEFSDTKRTWLALRFWAVSYLAGENKKVQIRRTHVLESGCFAFPKRKTSAMWRAYPSLNRDKIRLINFL